MKVWEYSAYPDLHSIFNIELVSMEETLFVVKEGSILSLSMDGYLLWETEDEGIRGYTPAAAHKRIYLGILDGILCLDAHTGEIVWRYEDTDIIFESPPIVTDEYVIIGSMSGHFDIWGPDATARQEEAEKKRKRVLCLSAETGEVIWEFYQYHLLGDVSPAYFDGKIYINNGGGAIFCLSVETGEIIWANSLEGFSGSSLSLNEDHIFGGTLNGVLCCHSRQTGKLLWKFDCGNIIYATPAIGYGKVFFGSKNGTFYCVDSQTGTLVWELDTGATKETPGDPFFSAIIVADEKVAFGTTDGRLFIVDASSGDIINSLCMEKRINSLILSDGRFFVGEGSGKITCFEEAPPGSTPESSPVQPEITDIPSPSDSSQSTLTPILVLSSLVLMGILIAYYFMRRSPKNTR